MVNQFAQENFSKNLWESSEGKSIGLSYFKERGFEENTIRFFGLGYSLKKFDNLYSESLGYGYDNKYLLETGLIIKNDKGYIDRFRRIIFQLRVWQEEFLDLEEGLLFLTQKQPSILIHQKVMHIAKEKFYMVCMKRKKQ